MSQQPPAPRARHGLGLIPDSYDHRDLPFAAPSPEAIAALPPAVDLRGTCSPVRSQGNLGSCTGFSMSVGLREFLEIKSGNPSPMVPLSPLFLYYEERLLEGTVDQDSGAMIRDGLKVLQQMGVCPEADDPYDVSKFTQAPSQPAITAAKMFTISAYHRIQTLIPLKTALAGGNGAVLGVTVYESFESPDADRTGHIPIPQRGEQRLGGHAIFCVGYRDDANYAGGGYVIFKNSWGTGWGDQGYGYLPYQYVSNHKLTSDIWTASL